MKDLFSQKTFAFRLLRQTNKAKHFFWALLLVLAALTVSSFLLTYSRNVFAQTAYPFLSEETDFYLEADAQSLASPQYRDSVVSFIAGASGMDRTLMASMLETISSLTDGSFGVFLENGELYGFLPVDTGSGMPEREFILSDGRGLSIKLIGREVPPDKPYLLFGTAPRRQRENLSERIIEAKLRLVNKRDGYQGTWFWRPRKEHTFTGVLDISSGLVMIDGSDTPNVSERIEAEIPDTPLYLSLAGALPFGGELSADFFHALVPGTLTVFSGTLQQLLDYPYASFVQWTWEGDSDQAQRFQKQVLKDISSLYPVAVQRPLPDESFIFELKRDSSPFYSEMKDSTSNVKALITYQDGQITVRDDGKESVFSHVETDPEPGRRSFSCLLPSALGYGSVDGDFLEDVLWKKLGFSWNQQEIILCFSVDHQDIHSNSALTPT